MSRTVWTPAIGGTSRTTHWFYERARGQYIHISPDNFEFILPDNIEDAEALERTIEDHWKDEFLKHCKEFLKNTESGRNLTSQVSSLLEENVFVYAQHFMGYDADTAYANWIQFMNAVEFMKAKQGDFRTLGGLFKLLRQHIVGAETAYHYDMESVEYCLDNLKFTVRQEVCEQ